MLDAQYFLLYTLGWTILLQLTIPFHELGHFLAIKQFGGQIYSVELTSGKPMFKHGKFSIGMKFWAGKVSWDETSIKSNTKTALVAFAGPLTDWILSILIFSISFFLYTINLLSYSSFVFLFIFSILQFLNSIFEMIPNKKKKNDGYNFLIRLNLIRKVS